ncbi:MAG: hypothetical protein GY870_22585, partial [archaeon]|nr:hypothetical protein [archaeon]
TVDIEKTSDNRLNFSLFYDLNVWMGSGSCYGNEATAMDDNLNYIVNASNCVIEEVYHKPDESDYVNNLFSTSSYFFINTESIEIGQKVRITHDDIMIFRGTVFCSNINLFSCIDNNTEISIDGQLYDVVHLRYDYNSEASFGYTGFICGLDSGNIINATVDLYYEKNSGMLLYSNGEYFEYNAANPTKWDRHLISKTIIFGGFNYIGEPNDFFSNIFNFFISGDNRNEIMIIALIIIGTLGIITLMKKRNFKQKLEILKGIDNIENKLKQQIEELEKELGYYES